MSAGAFRCGHPKTPANMKIGINGIAQCRSCHNVRTKEYKRREYASRTADERWLDYRVRYLPKQLEAARRKVASLENEARRYGMTDLLR